MIFTDMQRARVFFEDWYCPDDEEEMQDAKLASQFEEVRAEGRAEGLIEAACQLVEDVRANEDDWRQTPNFRAHNLAEVKWGAAKVLFQRWEANRAAKSPTQEGES